MAISGSFMAVAATRQPMAAKPPPASRHGAKEQPDNAWSPPPAPVGGGAPWAEGVTPAMAARGLVMDMGHRWGHGATPKVRRGRRPWTVGALLGRRTDAFHVAELEADQASAGAHGDSTAGYYQGHQYDPQPMQFAGSSYEVLPNNVGAVPGMSAQQIVHDRPGGQHLAGDGGQFAPTGFPTGIGGPAMPRWAVARYSSPTIGAMYSRNTLRGILPQVATVPVSQPALKGVRESGIPGNTRWVMPRFTTPALYRTPPSESDRIMAGATPAPEGPTMSVGF